MMAKKGTPRGIAYREALEEALCWGWIDGKIHRDDDRYFVQWFSPRRPRSIWSLANRRTVDRLAREGRMQPAGSPGSPRRRRTAAGRPRTRRARRRA